MILSKYGGGEHVRWSEANKNQWKAWFNQEAYDYVLPIFLVPLSMILVFIFLIGSIQLLYEKLK